VADSITLRQSCRLYLQSVPDDTVLIKWANLLQHYHNGVEGRISVPKRRDGLDRCRYHGKKGFERWVGWGIIAHNLHVIGSALTAD
jgi:hypothetical protein